MPQTSFHLSLTSCSGLLYERIPLLLLVSAHRSETVACHSGVHHARLYIRLNCCFHRGVLDHQIHWTLQVFRHSRSLHLHSGLVSLVTLVERETN